MKLYIQIAIFALALITTFASRQAIEAQDLPEQLPTLRGERAVEQLKRTGQYDSLAAAVKQANGENQSDLSNTVRAIVQTGKLTASGGASNDRLGYSVSISGDYAVVGAPLSEVNSVVDQGAAFVFVRNGKTWSEQARLIAADGTGNDQFGYSVAINGNTVIVGAPFADIGSNTDRGAAYIFVRAGTNWSQQAKLITNDGSAGDQFGYSVSIDADSVVVGSPFDFFGVNESQGSASVFVRNGAIWSEQAKLTAADGGVGDLFGISVSISGNTVLIGAYLDDVGTNANQGSAYVYTRLGSNWSQQTQLIAPDGATGDRFGFSVSISGDRVIIGSPQDNIGASTDQGSAYVFVRNADVWSFETQLIAPDGAAADRFGTAIALGGDTAIVGAYLDSLGAGFSQGSSYVFVRSGNTWTLAEKLTALDVAESDFFGWSVAVSGDSFLVGAYGNNSGSTSDKGAAYVFRPLDGSWTGDGKTIASDGTAGDNFGLSVSISGNTAIIGAPNDSGPAPSQGSAYVFVRNGASWVQQAKLKIANPVGDDHFGVPAIYGDTAVIGAYGSNSVPGAAYVFVRTGTIWTERAKLTPPTSAGGDFFGAGVAIEGNTIIVRGNTSYVFVGSAANWTQQAILNTPAPFSVDVSGDTVIIGDTTNAAYVFTRSNTTWTQQTVINAPTGANGFGTKVSIDRDTAIVGAYLENVNGNAFQGAAYIFVRNGTTWTQQVKLTPADQGPSKWFGFSVCIDKDIAVVGASVDSQNLNGNQGSAYVFERVGNVWTQTNKLSDPAGATGDEFGTSVAVSADKIVVGVPFSNVSASNSPAESYSGNDFIPAASDQGAALFYINQPLAPTAATVKISGKVLAANGGLRNAVVTLTDARGNSRSVRSGIRGGFHFADVEAGETYIISVVSRHYLFQPRVIFVTEEVSDFNFTAVSQTGIITSL